MHSKQFATESERKYLVDIGTDFDTFREVFLACIPFGLISVSRITQTYLIPSNPRISEMRIRKEEFVVQNVKDCVEYPDRYTLTSKTDTDIPGVSKEDEVHISKDRYDLFVHTSSLLANAYPVHKARFRIPIPHFTFELDFFYFVHENSQRDSKAILIGEVELPDIKIEPEFPFPWRMREVTGLKEYKNRSIAQGLLFPGYRTVEMLE